MSSRFWYTGYVILIITGITGCTVGPRYKRPPTTVPDIYRGAVVDADKQNTSSLADEKWWAIFQDPALQELIRTALNENYDLRIAATRILQAQAVLGIRRADQFPTITGQAGAAIQRFPNSKNLPVTETSANTMTLSMAWELDFWGKFRRATEAARAELLATEWGRRAVTTSLVRDVASAYFQLRELDLEMEISRRALASRQ